MLVILIAGCRPRRFTRRRLGAARDDLTQRPSAVGGTSMDGDYGAGVSRVARPALGYVLTLAAAGFFAVNGTVSTLALEAGIEPTRLTALRCTGAAIGLLAVLAVVAPDRLRITWR